MPLIEVRNKTANPIARGGWTIPPDGKWHTINVPEYRIKEVMSASYLEHRFPGEDDVEQDTQPEDETLQDGQSGADLDVQESDEDGDSDDEDSDDEDSVEEINLDELSYAELQEMAKGYGIKANQSREDLTAQILAADEEE